MLQFVRSKLNNQAFDQEMNYWKQLDFQALLVVDWFLLAAIGNANFRFVNGWCHFRDTDYQQIFSPKSKLKKKHTM